MARTLLPQDTNQTFTLPSGRTLGYASYGSPSGPAIFFFHGFPSSRLEYPELHPVAQKLGVRIIAIDRPGMGLSSFQPNRKILDWPSDVDQLARHLKFSQYRVVGSSGGGPYAVACAKVLPRSKLLSVGVLAGLGPWEFGTKGMRIGGRALFNFLSWSPAANRWLWDWYAKCVIKIEGLEERLRREMRWLNERDRKIMAREDTVSAIAECFRESFRQGGQGNAHEAWLCTKSWGFDLKNVEFEGVKLWYGSEDRNTPPRMGWQMAERLPRAVMKEYQGDSHFTIVENHSEEILRELMESG